MPVPMIESPMRPERALVQRSERMSEGEQSTERDECSGSLPRIFMASLM